MFVLSVMRLRSFFENSQGEPFGGVEGRASDEEDVAPVALIFEVLGALDLVIEVVETILCPCVIGNGEHYAL